MTVTQGTVALKREFPEPIARVFGAWSSESAQRNSGDPGEGWSMTFDHFAFAVGDEDICRFGADGGREYINRNRYLEIVPNARLVYATSLESEGKLAFAGIIALTFDRTPAGTAMRFVEQGLYLDGQDDPQSHQRGWEAMFDALAEYISSRALSSMGYN